MSGFRNDTIVCLISFYYRGKFNIIFKEGVLVYVVRWQYINVFVANVLFSVFFFLKILFRFREGKGGRETSMCGCLSSAPHWRPGPQPRHMP